MSKSNFIPSGKATYTGVYQGPGRRLGSTSSQLLLRWEKKKLSEVKPKKEIRPYVFSVAEAPETPKTVCTQRTRTVFGKTNKFRDQLLSMATAEVKSRRALRYLRASNLPEMNRRIRFTATVKPKPIDLLTEMLRDQLSEMETGGLTARRARTLLRYENSPEIKNRLESGTNVKLNPVPLLPEMLQKMTPVTLKSPLDKDLFDLHKKFPYKSYKPHVHKHGLNRSIQNILFDPSKSKIIQDDEEPVIPKLLYPPNRPNFAHLIAQERMVQELVCSSVSECEFEQHRPKLKIEMMMIPTTTDMATGTDFPIDDMEGSISELSDLESRENSLYLNEVSSVTMLDKPIISESKCSCQGQADCECDHPAEPNSESSSVCQCDDLTIASHKCAIECGFPTQEKTVEQGDTNVEMPVVMRKRFTVTASDSFTKSRGSEKTKETLSREKIRIRGTHYSPTEIIETRPLTFIGGRQMVGGGRPNVIEKEAKHDSFNSDNLNLRMDKSLSTSRQLLIQRLTAPSTSSFSSRRHQERIKKASEEKMKNTRSPTKVNKNDSVPQHSTKSQNYPLKKVNSEAELNPGALPKSQKKLQIPASETHSKPIRIRKANDTKTQSLASAVESKSDKMPLHVKKPLNPVILQRRTTVPKVYYKSGHKPKSGGETSSPKKVSKPREPQQVTIPSPAESKSARVTNKPRDPLFWKEPINAELASKRTSRPKVYYKSGRRLRPDGETSLSNKDSELRDQQMGSESQDPNASNGKSKSDSEKLKGSQLSSKSEELRKLYGNMDKSKLGKICKRCYLAMPSRIRTYEICPDCGKRVQER